VAKLSEDDRVEKQLFLFLTASEREEQFAVEAPVRRRKPSVDLLQKRAQ